MLQIARNRVKQRHTIARKYFFNLRLVIYFLVEKVLGVDLSKTQGPFLKDARRAEKQRGCLEKLVAKSGLAEAFRTASKRMLTVRSSVH